MHRQFLAELKSGDKVITKGGIYGTITGLTDTAITLEIDKETRIKVTRDSIAGSAVKAEAAPAKKKGA